MSGAWYEHRDSAYFANAEGRVLGEVHHSITQGLYRAAHEGKPLGFYITEDSAKAAIEAAVSAAQTNLQEPT